MFGRRDRTMHSLSGYPMASPDKPRLANGYMRATRAIWNRLPKSFRSTPPLVAFGNHVHSLVLKSAGRGQSHGTFFLRNRAELELMRRLAARISDGSRLDIGVFGCSKGAEVYSIAWTLKAAPPNLKINIHASDISPDIVEFARQGVYSSRDPGLCETIDQDGVLGAGKLHWDTQRDQLNVSIFDRMSEIEKDEIFDRDGDCMKVKPQIKEGISWCCADAGDPNLVSVVGRQDIVVANRFLCHVDPASAERILRNLVSVLKPGGFLFVSGIDLDVRTRVALDMKWKPVTELMKEVYEGDPSLRSGWPLEYWGTEPFQARRRNATIRYASAFQIS
jgi:chemotaxis methyl-accepting protein methylase